eukprot:TRINITY_DN7688_c0_g3_i1.p1 TRINITY_DN7688_c0_g3~~TRINITY_DN7688_c0_g3_i1.p1  ORF type:complete len:408 (-),score=26.63 TRINITY_DN7688_c0_g3_i1:464-1687(-)
MSSPKSDTAGILQQTQLQSVPLNIESVSTQIPASPFAVPTSMVNCPPSLASRLTPDAPEWTPPPLLPNEKEPTQRSLSTTGVFISLNEDGSQYSSPQGTARMPSAPLNSYPACKEPDVLHIASLLNNLNASSTDAMFQNTQGLVMEDLVNSATGGNGFVGDQAETLAAKLISQLQDNAISNPALLLQHLLGFAPEDYNDLVTALSESGCNYIEIVAAYLHNIKVQAQENGGGSSSSPGVAAAARQVVLNKYDYLINELNRFKSMKDPATNLLNVARMANDQCPPQINSMFVGSPYQNSPMFDMGQFPQLSPRFVPFKSSPVPAVSPVDQQSPRFLPPPFQSGVSSPRTAFMASGRIDSQQHFLADNTVLRPAYATPSPPPPGQNVLPPSLPASALATGNHQLFISQQ